MMLNNIKDKNYLTILFFLILSVTIIIFIYRTKSIEQKLAWEGASPHNYVTEKLKPQYFQKNWEAAGVGKYDYSLTMKIYYYLAKYLNIEPSTTLYPYMFFQILLFIISIAFISHALFQNQLVTILAIIIIPQCNLAGLNLSRFAYGFGTYLSYPLFYGYANAFRLFAIGFFLKNRYIISGIFLTLSIYSHTTIGLLATAFIGGYLFFNPKLIKNNSFIAGIIIFFITVFPHFLNISSNASISTGGMDLDDWVKLTKIFSYHWYPMTMRLFTKFSIYEFFPILLALLFLYVSLRYNSINNEITKKIFAGIVICVSLTIIGIVFSDINPIPVIIKFSPQRSSGMITFFSVLYLIYYLVKKVESGNYITRFISIYALGIMLFSKPGIAIIPTFILLSIDLKEGFFSPLLLKKNSNDRTNQIYVKTIWFFILLIAIIDIIHDLNISYISRIMSFAFNLLWTPLQFFNPFSNFDFLIRGGSFKSEHALSLLITFSIFTSVLLYMEKIFKNQNILKICASTILIALIGIIWHLELVNYENWRKRYSQITISYLEAQIWAKTNSSKGALFMTDPTHYYGWRDFSERSSFGNLREWGYSSITYNPDRNKFKEGIKRIKEFGIDINSITSADIQSYESFPYADKFNETVKTKFYSESDRWRLDLSRRYGIDYFVMQKEYISYPSKLNVAFENKHYVIYSIN